MRVSVTFEGSCRPLHISPHQTVGAIKKIITELFFVHPSEDEDVQRYLELSYAGAVLQDTWRLSDFGIATGSTIRCQLKEVSKAVLHVFSTITKEALPIMGPVTMLRSSVSKLKSVVSLQLGIPVSSFRLSTVSGLHLYDCNLLSDYAVQAGGSLLLETWEGWTEFLRACLRGHKHTVQRHLSEEKPVLRFQKRVALSVAAAHGHLDLSGWLIDGGVRAEDPVGVHPYRTWCYQTAHPDSLKCPAQAAVEAGQLLILKLFVSSSITNLACCDADGRSLLQTAIQHRRRECVTYLASKLYTTVNFPGCSLPMHIYLRIKTWTCKARARRRHPLERELCDPVHVDGIPMQKKSSNPRGRGLIGCVEVKEPSCGFLVTSSFMGPSCACHRPASPPSQSVSAALPQLHPRQTMKSARRDVTRSRACGRKNPKEILPAGNSNESGRVVLPHAFPDISHSFLINRSSKPNKIPAVPQETFKLLNGRSLRENAIHCLAIASSFTEKPWLKQIALAQTLARRTLRDDLETCSDKPLQNTLHNEYRGNLSRVSKTCCQDSVFTKSLASRMYFQHKKSTFYIL